MSNILRVIDANIDRASEALRILEDFARFLLEDKDLSLELRTLRHQLPKSNHLLYQLLEARQSSGDVGAHTEDGPDTIHRDLTSAAIANSRRAQEALRVLEESAKIYSDISSPNPSVFQQMRFRVYELEKQLVLKLLRKDRLLRFRGLYVIIDIQILHDRDVIGITQQAIKGGASIIQLRDKRQTDSASLELSRNMRHLCTRSNVLFIINDHIDRTLACNADGIHLGQGDMPISEARQLLPIHTIIGCSTSTLSEARHAQLLGADYVAVGSIYPTESKEQFRLAGIDTLKEVSQELSVPLVAIGGINKTNIVDVVEAGAKAIAIISAATLATNVYEATKNLILLMGSVEHKNVS
ncbi:MAG: thiamine phosphate synthase [Chloroflexota bacterium]|nr:thiamine phosphate synthase [Chloroflexota bacterium]